MKKILYIFIIALVFSPLQSHGQVCLKEGYSVFTINGMFTSRNGSIHNRDSLKKFLPSKFNNEEITVDYLHNPSHIGGIGEIFTVAYQKFFDTEIVEDHDFVQLLRDASDKVKTQKILLVAHSQGNFYANSLYDFITGRDEAITKSSLGIYGVATPSSRVAGNGKYITSNNDKIINLVRTGGMFNVLPGNTNISYSSNDDPNGHSFSEIYLEYEKDRIVSEIKSSLKNLSNSGVKNENTLCITPPNVTLGHRIIEGFLFFVDPVALAGKYAIVGAVNGAKYVSDKFAHTVINFSNSLVAGNGAVAVVGYNQASQTSEEPKESKNSQKEDVKKEEKKDNKKIEIKDPSENLPPPLFIGHILDSSQPTGINEFFKSSINPRSSGGGGGGGVNNPTEENENADEKNEEEDLPEQDEESEEDQVEELPEEEQLEEENEEAEPEPGEDPAPSYEYTYIPKYSFGLDDEGRDWQVWAFNGSYVYDWTNTYVNGYLREQFKIHTMNGPYWCSQCLERGIFSRDPREGFDATDVKLYGLDENPQNNMDGLQYDVGIQWDSEGYAYKIMKGDEIYAEGRRDIDNGVENLWTAWNGSFNHFKNFPSGDWIGDFPYSFLMGRTGGQSMVTEPYPVYIIPQISTDASLFLPTEGQFAETGIFPSQGRSGLTEFSFRVVYTNSENNPPSNINIWIDGDIVELEKITEGEGIFSDGDFTNGEMYGYTSSFPLGEYEYYFTAENFSGGELRIPNGDSKFSFKTVASTYTYIPKYSFGVDDEGRDWQVWAFNGSYVYDWKNLYRNGFLRQEFKIKTGGLGLWCGQCLQQGVFKHDPQKGFESSDFFISSFLHNPQNNMDEAVYDMTFVWNATGYRYYIKKGEQLHYFDDILIEDLDENTWIGWNGSYNNFKTFPSGDWFSVEDSPFSGYSGGYNMILKPYPLYESTLSL